MIDEGIQRVVAQLIIGSRTLKDLKGQDLESA